MPNMSVMVGSKRDQKPPRVTTPRRATLASAIKIMQAIQTIGRPEEKHACCMSQALYGRVKINQGILCQLLRTESTQQKRILLRRQ